jgi:chorismate mutase/prephenate dehydratase
MADLEELRTKIDAIDGEVVKLLDDRARIAIEIGKIKMNLGLTIQDAQREHQVLERIIQNVQALPPSAVQIIWREIMAACAAVQGRSTRVAFLGPAGTFTQIAAHQFFPKAGTSFIPETDPENIFQQVETGTADFGVVPIENSTKGSVPQILDLLVSRDVRIYGELEVVVHHNLMGLPGTDFSRVQVVYSHNQGIAQTRKWVRLNIPQAQLIEVASTAEAAKRVNELGNSENVAIGARAAASEYGLEVLAENIEDHAMNKTRFIVISRVRQPVTGNDRTSVVFVTRHVPGALFRVLQVFSEAGINLTKIESRPLPDANWEYVFIVDFIGHEETHGTVLEQIAENTLKLKVLGSYPVFAQNGH